MGYSIFNETMVDMTWVEIKKAVEQGAIALLPIGVIEEHGPHLGLGVDLYISYALSKSIKRELIARGIPTLIAPPYYWGINDATGVSPGSFTVRKETMKAVIYDILTALSRWGISFVFSINWHAEYNHNAAILEAIKEARTDTAIRAYSLLTDSDVPRLRLTGSEDYILVQQTPPPVSPPSQYIDMHAGSLETGIMLSYFPEQANAALAKTLPPTELTLKDLRLLRGGEETLRLIPGGYFGNPAGYNLVASKAHIESSARDFASLIENVMKNK